MYDLIKDRIIFDAATVVVMNAETGDYKPAVVCHDGKRLWISTNIFDQHEDDIKDDLYNSTKDDVFMYLLGLTSVIPMDRYLEVLTLYIDQDEDIPKHIDQLLSIEEEFSSFKLPEPA